MNSNLLTPQWQSSSSLEKLDRRSRRTRNALAAALFALLDEKPLSAISVTELTALADVNRATFYTHYQDVFHMYDQIKEEICRSFAELIEVHTDEIYHGEHRALLRDVYHYFDSNSDLLGFMLEKRSSDNFFEEVGAVLSDQCYRAIYPREVDDETKMLSSYQFNFICMGVVGVLRLWLTTGKHEPIELMVNMTANMMKPLDKGLLERNRTFIERDGEGVTPSVL